MTRKFVMLLSRFPWSPVHSKKDLGGIVKGFKENNFDVYIIVDKFNDQLFAKEHNLNVIELKLSDGSRYYPILLEEIFKIVKMLKSIKPDVILSVGWFTNILTLILIKLLFRNVRIILKLDSDGSPLIRGSLLRRIYRYSYFTILGLILDLFTVESSCGYEIFSRIPTLKKKLVIIPNTIDEKMIHTKSLNREKTILSVGRISREKGHDILIRAFEKISNKYPNYRVEIVGFIDDQDYYNELQNLARTLGLKDKVKIMYLDNYALAEKYASSSIFCLCLRFEGFSIARLEALANGLYTIITEAGCGKDLVKYGAHVVPVDDIDSTAQALENAINKIENGEFNFNSIKFPSYKELTRMILTHLNEKNERKQMN